LIISEQGMRAVTAIRRSRNDWLEARLGKLTAEELVALDAAIAPLARLVEIKL
jgi:hypothetical protein